MEYRFITIIAAAKIRNIPLTALTALEEVFLIKQIRKTIHAIYAIKMIPRLRMNSDKRKSRFITVIDFSELKAVLILSFIEAPPCIFANSIVFFLFIKLFCILFHSTFSKQFCQMLIFRFRVLSSCYFWQAPMIYDFKPSRSARNWSSRSGISLQALQWFNQCHRRLEEWFDIPAGIY